VAPQSFTVAAVAAAAAAVASAVAAAAVVAPDGEVVAVCAVFPVVARYRHTHWPPYGPPRSTSCPGTSSSTTRTTGAIGGGGHRPIISLLDSIF